MLWLLVLGIGSGVCWGTADFFGGLQARHLPALAVALWSQITGALILLLALIAIGRPPVLGSIAWGVVAGIFGGIALVLFYRGLATGVMSIVAPISACGAIVPVVVALVMGEVPSLLASLGIAVAIGGIILVSLHPEPVTRHVDNPRLTIVMALGAALGFGMFYVFLDRGSAVDGGSPLWATAGGRLGSLVLLGAMITLGRRPAPWPGRRIGAIAAIGVGDTTANVLFAYAALQGNLGIAAVLGSLYPVATILLGRIILAERLTRMQQAGVALALVGVTLLSAG